MTDEEVRRMVREAVKQAGTITAYARAIGSDHATLSRVMSGHEKISPRVLLALGLKRVITYEKK